MQAKRVLSLHKGYFQISGICLAALFSLVTRLKGIAPIGDNSELFVTGTASAQYNDNIFLSHERGQDDYILDLIPGLSYEFGKTNSLTTGQLAVSEDFNIYTNKTDLSNQLFNSVFATKYDDSKTSISIDASFHQVDQAERTIQNLGYLVNRNLAHAGAMGEIQLTDKSSLGAGLVWDDTDYKTTGFSDWRFEQIPVNYYLKFEPKLDLSAGFRFQNNTLGVGGIDSRTYYYNIGARGEFTPNLTGKFTIGYDEQRLDNGKTNGGIGADSGFTYAYSPKSTVNFGITDDFGYAATGSTFRSFGAYVGFNSSITEQWMASGQLSYNRYTYISTPQRDDFYTARVGLSYVYSTNISFSGNYTYSYDNSTFSNDSFKNSLFSVSATLHY